jgi:hypothetical protein
MTRIGTARQGQSGVNRDWHAAIQVCVAQGNLHLQAAHVTAVLVMHTVTEWVPCSGSSAGPSAAAAAPATVPPAVPVVYKPSKSAILGEDKAHTRVCKEARIQGCKNVRMLGCYEQLLLRLAP